MVILHSDNNSDCRSVTEVKCQLFYIHGGSSSEGLAKLRLVTGRADPPSIQTEEEAEGSCIGSRSTTKSVKDRI